MKFFVQPPAQAQMEPPPVQSDSSLPLTGDNSGDLSQEEPARVLTPRDKVYNILLAATDKEGFADFTIPMCDFASASDSEDKEKYSYGIFL